MKVCSKCKEEKDVSEFGTRNRNKSKLRSQCKSCEKEYRDANKDKAKERQRINYIKNKEKIDAVNKEYYKNNKERLIKIACEKQKNNREEVNKRKREWRKNTKEIRAAVDKKYREENKDRLSEKTRENNRRRWNEDILFRFKGIIRNNISNSIRREGFSKNTRTFSILGCSYEFFRGYIEAQFTKGMSWERFNEIDLDHIIPISSAKTEEDVIRLCHYTNYRPLWRKDNKEKGTKIIEGIQFKLL